MIKFLSVLVFGFALSFSAHAAERAVNYDKSRITFSIKQMGVSVSGGFKTFTARVDLDPANLPKASAEISVDIGSISTGTEEGDGEAMASAWLNRAGFPKASFKSTSVRAIDAQHFEARGTLTIRGTARDITVPFTLLTPANGDATLSGNFSIRRTDFGIGGGEWNQEDLVANEVPIHFQLLLTQAAK